MLYGSVRGKRRCARGIIPRRVTVGDAQRTIGLDLIDRCVGIAAEAGIQNFHPATDGKVLRWPRFEININAFDPRTCRIHSSKPASFINLQLKIFIIV